MGNQGNTNSLWSKLQVRFYFCYLSWSQLLIIITIFLCRQPEGCLQWHTTLTGRFQTFNFAETTTPQHLASQKCVKNYYLPSFLFNSSSRLYFHIDLIYFPCLYSYEICIRNEANYCCIQYALCSDSNSYSLDNVNAAAKQDSECAEDFIEIDGKL